MVVHPTIAHFITIVGKGLSGRDETGTIMVCEEAIWQSVHLAEKRVYRWLLRHLRVWAVLQCFLVSRTRPKLGGSIKAYFELLFSRAAWAHG